MGMFQFKCLTVSNEESIPAFTADATTIVAVRG